MQGLPSTTYSVGLAFCWFSCCNCWSSSSYIAAPLVSGYDCWSSGCKCRTFDHNLFVPWLYLLVLWL